MAAQTNTGRNVLDTIDEFRLWTDHHGVSVDRFFAEQTITVEDGLEKLGEQTDRAGETRVAPVA